MGKSIAVAGKGGTGKSTIAALLVLTLRKRGEKPILAVDADPDSNLGTLLGIDDAQSIGDMREEVLKGIKDFPAGMSKAAFVEAGLHQIIDESEGFDLMTMGRGEGSGCYCYLNSLIRKFSDDLTPSYSWVVIDNEAGLEHLARRTTRDVDALIIVVGDNPLSLNSAERIRDITQDLDSRIKHRYVVTNMVRPENLGLVHDRIKKLELEIISDIPYDLTLSQMILKNGSLSLKDDLTVNANIDNILEKM